MFNFWLPVSKGVGLNGGMGGVGWVVVMVVGGMVCGSKSSGECGYVGVWVSKSSVGVEESTAIDS